MAGLKEKLRRSVSRAARRGSAHRHAAIDIGSNSVHLLVALGGRGRPEPLLDESTLLGLGDVVDREGFLPPAAVDELLATLVRYTRRARRSGASEITLLGTEPFRRAANGAEVAAKVAWELGTPLHLLSQDEEAYLTLLGVTGGLAALEPLLVVDIGGGSSEYVLLDPDGRLHVGGLPTGSARLGSLLIHHDPPMSDELDLVRGEARRNVAALPDGHPTRAVVVGGTSTNLVRLAPGGRETMCLTRPALAEMLELLGQHPASEIVARFGVSSRRARQLASGAAIVEAFLLRYGLDATEVSTTSLRDGVILAVEHGGDEWRERLPALCRGAVMTEKTG